MKSIGIFYGSSTGYTADVANRIAEALGVSADNVYDVANTAPSKLGDYDIVLLGSSTWGVGDLQTDWYDFIAGAEVLDLEGKVGALFGCGDESMSDSFCGALAEIYRRMKVTGLKFIGEYNTDGYNFAQSESVDENGVAVGLTLDEVNHADLTAARIADWVKSIKAAAE